MAILSLSIKITVVIFKIVFRRLIQKKKETIKSFSITCYFSLKKRSSNLLPNILFQNWKILQLIKIAILSCHLNCVILFIYLFYILKSQNSEHSEIFPPAGKPEIRPKSLWSKTGTVAIVVKMQLNVSLTPRSH